MTLPLVCPRRKVSKPMLKFRKMIVATLAASLFGSSIPMAQAGHGYSEVIDRDGQYKRYDHRDHDEWRGRRADWDRLGTVAAQRELDRDVIDLGKRGARYSALMFRVERGDIVLEDLKITYQDDSVYSPDLKMVFREGERSCVIDMPPDAGKIKRIRFLYRSAGRHHDAVVDVYGLR